MKYLIVFFALFIFSSCDITERERQIEERTRQLNLKEAELQVREQALATKEQELLDQKKQLDSTAQDTTFVYHPEVVGTWSVKMECTETSCSGSAIGDTKLEQWYISYHDKLVIAKVMMGKKVSRVYTGDFNDNILELTSQSFENDPNNTTIMLIRLQKTGDGLMEGQRQIIRPENCRIVYSLKMSKQQEQSILN